MINLLEQLPKIVADGKRGAKQTMEAPRQQLAPRIADPQAGFPIIPEPVLPYVLADLSKYSNLDWYTRILVRKDRSGPIKARKYPFLGN